MMSDITLGQFFPGHSVIHKLDPRMKIVLTIVYMVMLFLADNAWSLALTAVFLTAVVLLSRVPVRLTLKSIKPLLPIIIFMTLINVFYVSGGPVLWRWGFVVITSKGLALAVFMTVRIVFLIVSASMLTYTTSPIALTDALESLMSPLKRVHLPVHELSMMMTIALRFIPLLIEETDKIISAQKARGADFETGNLMRRLRALTPIIIPLFVSAYRRAGELALAMDCRCYRGGEGRTRLNRLRMGTADFVSAAVSAVILALVIALNILFGSLI